MKEVFLLELGRIDYAPAWHLQKQLVELRAASSIPDVLIILEHEHVFTMGRKGDPTSIPLIGVPVYHIERGGFGTYHGPGQVVGYPIIHLQRRSSGIKEYISTLEQALMDATENLGLHPSRVEGHPGVWVEGRKLASIGVAVQKWVTFHGFAYNVNTDLTYFQKISPCGLDPTLITSVENEIGHRVDFEMAKRTIIHALENNFENMFSHELPAAISSLLPSQALAADTNLYRSTSTS